MWNVLRKTLVFYLMSCVCSQHMIRRFHYRRLHDDEVEKKMFGHMLDYNHVPKYEDLEFSPRSGVRDVVSFMNEKIEQLQEKHKMFSDDLNHYFETVREHFNEYYDKLFDANKKSDKDHKVPVIQGGSDTSDNEKSKNTVNQATSQQGDTSDNEKPENTASQAASQQDESTIDQKPAKNNDAKGIPAEQEVKKDVPAPVEDDGKEAVIAPSSSNNEEITIKPKEESIRESDKLGEPEASHERENAQTAPSSEQ